MLAVVAQNVLEKSRLRWCRHTSHPVTGEMSGALQLNDEGRLHACIYL